MKMPQTILQNIFVKKLCKNGKTPSADKETRLQRALYGAAVLPLFVMADHMAAVFAFFHLKLCLEPFCQFRHVGNDADRPLVV